MSWVVNKVSAINGSPITMEVIANEKVIQLFETLSNFHRSHIGVYLFTKSLQSISSNFDG